MKILNLTQHVANADQLADGVVEPDNKELVRALLTFDEKPTLQVREERAFQLAHLARDGGFSKAMIGGAPFFMSTLERALFDADVQPVYAFTKRISVEQDGVKKSRFVYEGMVDDITT